jgi:hypothetical protein
MSNLVNNREYFTPTECMKYQIEANLRSKSRYENGAIKLTERANIAFNKVISSIGLTNSNMLKDLYARIYANSVQILTLNSDISAFKKKVLTYRKYQKERKELDDIIKMKETELEHYQHDNLEAQSDSEAILSQINKINELKITSLLESVVKDEYISQEYRNEIVRIDMNIDGLNKILLFSY